MLPAVLASAGCLKWETTTGSDDGISPPPPTSILRWAGTARFSETHILAGNRDYKTTFEGPVTWQKEENPDRPPADAVVYRISSGQMHVAYGGTRFLPSDTCRDVAAADVDLAANDPRDETKSYLYLWPDGKYAGAVLKTATVTITRTCDSGFVGSFSGELRMSLDIDGTLTAGRQIQGEMAPDGAGGITATGSWDFAPM